MRPPLPAAETLEARGISRDIEKNRGLTRYRPRDKKNPRKNLRDKFSKALVRRGGVVPKQREKGIYRGEETGIRKSVAKSRKFSK